MISTQQNVTVVLAPALLRLFPTAPPRLELEATTVAEAIAALDTQWPGMGHMLADESPALRKHINVFVDGQRASFATALPPRCVVHMLTAVSGG